MYAIVTRLSDGRWTDNLGQLSEQDNRFTTWTEAVHAVQELRVAGLTDLQVVSTDLLSQMELAA